MSEELHANIRSVLGHCIGRAVVDITQDDKDEWQKGESFIQFMFDDGSTLRMPVTDEGFWYEAAPNAAAEYDGEE